MSKFKAKVFIRLKPSVLDPAGEATKSASERMGVNGLSNFRIGKLIELDIESLNEEKARQEIELLADKLLSNPVIEDWSYVLDHLDPVVSS